MPDAFIWYHADEKLESKLMEWLDEAEEHAGVRGNLFVRKENEQSTFMETYRDVSSATIARIEALAAKKPLFKNITRHCESFQRVDKL